MGFFAWYERRITESLLASAVILYLQIPHTLSAADCFFRLGIGVYGQNAVADFLLYGIDLLEAIPLIAITLSIISRVKHNF